VPRLQDLRDWQRDTSLHLRRISMEGENNSDSDPACIRRGDAWIRPKPSTVMVEDDVLIASGYAEGEEDLEKLASNRG